MKITVTANLIHQFLPEFSIEAIEAICNYFEEYTPDVAPMLGDIRYEFCEVEPDCFDEEDEEFLIAELSNGNRVYAR